MIEQTNSPLRQELIDESEFSVPVENAESEEPHGPTVNLHGEDVSLSLALDELASAMKTLEMASEAVKELQDAIKPTILDLGGAEDARIIAKVTKGREKTEHAIAVMEWVHEDGISPHVLMATTIEHSTVAWAKVSKALNVPKATLGRHTAPPAPPTVSFKLKEVA